MQFYAKKFEDLSGAEVYELLKARSAVFQMEQNIHYLDEDDVDYQALHCFLMEKGKVSACLRAFRDSDDPDAVHIGRVLSMVHGHGLGRILMEKSEAAISDIFKPEVLVMDAQFHAVGFYEKLGFTVVSGEFLEEGILHKKMEKRIQRRQE